MATTHGDKLKLINYSYILEPNGFSNLSYVIDENIVSYDWVISYNGQRSENKKLIDAFDIDWKPYGIKLDNGEKFDIKTTSDVISCIKSAMSNYKLKTEGSRTNSTTNINSINNIYYDKVNQKISYTFTNRPGIRQDNGSEVFLDYYNGSTIQGSYNFSVGFNNITEVGSSYNSILGSNIYCNENSTNNIIFGSRNSSYSTTYTLINGSLNNTNSSKMTLILGSSNNIWRSNDSIIGGKFNYTGQSFFSLIGGYDNYIDTAKNALIVGEGLNTYHYNESVIGKYNVSNMNQIFAVGIGTINNRKNALEVYNDGSVIIHDSLSVQTLYVDDIIGGNNMISGTYEEICTLINNNNLQGGRFYRIIDYQCKLNNNESSIISTQKTYQIIVPALTTNKLAPDGWLLDGQLPDWFGYTLYKNDIQNYPNEIDTGDVYVLIGIVEWEGQSYYKWIKYEFDKNEWATDTLQGILLTDSNNYSSISINNPLSSEDFILLNYDGAIDEYFVNSEKNDVFVSFDNTNFFDENPDISYPEGQINTSINIYNIKYDINNDTTRFDWANNNGKGIIYWMKDQNENEAPYDFLSIQKSIPLNQYGFYDPSGNLQWCYTFNNQDENGNQISGNLNNFYNCKIIKNNSDYKSILHISNIIGGEDIGNGANTNINILGINNIISSAHYDPSRNLTLTGNENILFGHFYTCTFICDSSRIGTQYNKHLTLNNSLILNSVLLKINIDENLTLDKILIDRIINKTINLSTISTGKTYKMTGATEIFV